MNAHTLSRAHKKHIWCYKLKARTTTSIATRKKISRCAFGKIPTQTISIACLHIMLYSRCFLYVYASSRLTNRSRSQSRHARRVESTLDGHVRIHVRVFWSGFCSLSPSLHVCIFSDDDHTLDRAKSYYIHKFFEFLFGFSTHNEMVHLKRI